MTRSTRRRGVPVERISFVNALRWLRRNGESRPLGPRRQPRATRPHRAPRVKHRPKEYDQLNKPRRELRKLLLAKYLPPSLMQLGWSLFGSPKVAIGGPRCVTRRSTHPRTSQERLVDPDPRPTPGGPLPMGTARGQGGQAGTADGQSGHEDRQGTSERQAGDSEDRQGQRGQ